jgi:hypothetical protein
MGAAVIIAIHRDCWYFKPHWENSQIFLQAELARQSDEPDLWLNVFIKKCSHVFF